MLGGSRRAALKLHDRADELLREIAAPSAPVTEAVVELIDAMGDFDEDAGEVITEAAKDVLKFSFMRGYTLRLASDQPIDVPMPDGDPTTSAVLLMNEVSDDGWFYARAFPQGPKVWERLASAFAQIANAMLLEDQPEGPVFPAEVIDHMVRGGYLGGHVDEWFDLRPVSRQQQPAADEFELPPGIDVPEGMVAVPIEQVDKWVEQLSLEALEMATGKEPPDFIDTCAQVALPTLCGSERADTLPDETDRLAYNLFLQGYWCRAVEMRALATNEASAEVADQLRIAHDSRLWGETWFVTLQGASYGLAGGDEGSEDLIAALRSDLPQDMGVSFRMEYGEAMTDAVCEAIDASHPGASAYLSPWDIRHCWEAGYWMRAVSISLPDEAHIELRKH